MTWTSADLPDLAEHTAIVTGGNSGIGFHTARALAAHGASVVLACRRSEAGEQAAARLRKLGGDVTSAVLDLASMESVRAFAEAWPGPLDLLINNAGVMAPPKRRETSDGFELQFGTNHLGHFVLTGLLLPALRESRSGARVVTVSSIAHFSGDESVLDANAGPYQARLAYSNSKLANLLFARHLHDELTQRSIDVVSVAAHPGLSATGLASDRQGLGRNPVVRAVAPPLLHAFAQSSRAGARATLFAAAFGAPGSYTGPRWVGETRGPVGPAKVSSYARDDRLARRLWLISEELTGLRYAWT